MRGKVEGESRAFPVQCPSVRRSVPALFRGVLTVFLVGSATTSSQTTTPLVSSAQTTSKPGCIFSSSPSPPHFLTFLSRPALPQARRVRSRRFLLVLLPESAVLRSSHSPRRRRDETGERVPELPSPFVRQLCVDLPPRCAAFSLSFLREVNES